MSDTIPTQKPAEAMTIGECVRELLEHERGRDVVIGRVDRELASLRQDVHALAEAIEMAQQTIEAVQDEVYRHGQKVAPITACSGECHANVR